MEENKKITIYFNDGTEAGEFDNPADMVEAMDNFIDSDAAYSYSDFKF